MKVFTTPFQTSAIQHFMEIPWKTTGAGMNAHRKSMHVSLLTPTNEEMTVSHSIAMGSPPDLLPPSFYRWASLDLRVLQWAVMWCCTTWFSCFSPLLMTSKRLQSKNKRTFWYLICKKESYIEYQGCKTPSLLSIHQQRAGGSLPRERQPQSSLQSVMCRAVRLNWMKPGCMRLGPANISLF